MRFIQIAAASGLALTFLLTLRADTLTLRDGRVITGTLIGANRYEIRFASDSGRVQRIEVGNVDSISFGPYADPRPPASTVDRDSSADRYRPRSVYDNWPNGPQMGTTPAYATPPSSTPPSYGQAPSYGPTPAHRREPPYAPDDEASAAPAMPAYPSISSPNDYTIPAGARIIVRAVDPVDSDVSHIGDTFHASLEQPLIINGHMIAPAGSDAILQIVSASNGSREGSDEVAIALASITTGGRTYNLDPAVQRSAVQDDRARDTGERILIRGRRVHLPADTRLAFTLTSDVDL